MSRNRVLRRIFGPKRDQVTGEWRKLHNEELNVLYSSLNTIWVIKLKITIWVRHVARMGARTGAYKVLVGKPEGKRPLGRPRHGWEDNSNMDLRNWDGRAWTGLIWLRKETGGGHL
jgi:hypothetical protein